MSESHRSPSDPSISVQQRRKVYLEPIWKFHAFGKQMQDHPPPGYEFVVARQVQEKVFDSVSRWSLGRFMLRSTDLLLPTGLVKSNVERWNARPRDARLTYACDHLVLRPEPWVIEVEYASLVLGHDPKHLRRFRGFMARALASSYCKRVLCWAEVGRRSLLADLDSETFAHKVTVVPYAVPPRLFLKQYRDDTVKLLFVGSGTTQGGFDFRGGREALETFAQLRKRYDQVEMVVRSDIPADVRARYGGMPGLRIIEDFISREEMDREFQSADIFLIPSHNTSPMITLDAMSYELPAVTINAWANPEYVEDGKTGLVARSSTRLPYYYPGTRQPNWADPSFRKAIRTPDPEVLADLVSKVGLLIENPELRRRLGRAARWEVDYGRFSLAAVNRQLAMVFDDAIGDDHG